MKMLMRQLLRVQEGIEAPEGIMKLIKKVEIQCAASESIIVDEEESEEDGDGSDGDSERSDNGTVNGEVLDEVEEEEIDDATAGAQEEILLRHVRASKGAVKKKLQYQEFPTNRTFKRYKKKYGWTERKLEVLAAHRQSGSSGPALMQNYEELRKQYIMHDIQHPDQIIVTDEIHWQKSWENALALISCMVSAENKRAQSGGPGKLVDGVTCTPCSSIIGTLYAVQVILKESSKQISDSQVIDVMVASGFPRQSVVVHRSASGYQTAETFKKLSTFLIVRLHASEGNRITDDVKTAPLKRKYILIADGSSTHPFHEILFCLVLALVGLFFHQQEANSTHVSNLYDRFVFLITKLYAAKEVMMAILQMYSPPIETDEMATVWLETVVRELKGTINPDQECPSSEILITDPAVLAKLNSIVTFKCVPILRLKFHWHRATKKNPPFFLSLLTKYVQRTSVRHFEIACIYCACAEKRLAGQVPYRIGHQSGTPPSRFQIDSKFQLGAEHCELAWTMG